MAQCFETEVNKSLAQVPRETKLCTAAPNSFSIITAVFPLTTQKCVSVHVRRATSACTSHVHKSLRNCGSSVSNLLHINFLTPRIRMWLLDWKISGTLWNILHPQHNIIQRRTLTVVMKIRSYFLKYVDWLAGWLLGWWAGYLAG
jgi:hypothetical protein